MAGLASFASTRVLVDTFHNSAIDVEHEASTTARLRADLVAHSVVLASEDVVDQQVEAGRLGAAVATGFTQAIDDESSARARDLLESARVKWREIVAAAGPPGQPTALAARGDAVATIAPDALALLDEAGFASRADVRADLARAARLDRWRIVIVSAFELLVLLILVRLARRLTKEVIVPVGIIRDSANHLAAGELDHRIVVDRVDELGQLAMSFNAMADAIAGNQRSLTLEATTDSLSGLANRAAFRSRLGATLARPQRRSGDQAVLFVDLDDFKDVNDTLGHAAGDDLLRAVAGRLLEAVRPGDMVARLGGDEFALLLDGLADPGVARIVAERVVERRWPNRSRWAAGSPTSVPASGWRFAGTTPRSIP